ncbi:hypothetical protein E2C01_048210 [Portunus trituberculatus]|uniref:Uncharacterized protein n=1 Tax=Portunus trituberculatus TaxID=210409 RepID=A0A5B7G333_PORTR|nr:hypothetical protein [Portunus trituberculatus]
MLLHHPHITHVPYILTHTVPHPFSLEPASSTGRKVVGTSMNTGEDELYSLAGLTTSLTAFIANYEENQLRIMLKGHLGPQQKGTFHLMLQITK